MMRRWAADSVMIHVLELEGHPWPAFERWRKAIREPVFSEGAGRLSAELARRMKHQRRRLPYSRLETHMTIACRFLALLVLGALTAAADAPKAPVRNVVPRPRRVGGWIELGQGHPNPGKARP